MALYFEKAGDRFTGRPVTTLPVTLNNDLSRLRSPANKLKTSKDLATLRTTAQNRRRWKILTKKIKDAAEASMSDD